MSLQINDRVKETSITTGVIPIVLGGTSVGYQTISSSISSGNTFPYVVELIGGSEWEIGIGQYVSSNNSILRTQIINSSNTGHIVNFSAGTKNVFISIPAAYAPLTAKGLGQFATTTSAELAAIISDKTGSGNLVFANNAVFGSSNSQISPFTVTNNILVTNLNADLLDGQHGTYYTALSNSAYLHATAAYDKANTSASGLVTTSIKTSNYTASSNELVRCNTAAGSFSVTFPSNPIDGDIVAILDLGETFRSNNLILLPNTEYIEYDMSPYILDLDGAYASFIYNEVTTNWKLLESPVTLIDAITTVPVSQGGTGSNSLQANSVLLGNGTSEVQVVSPGTEGNLLTSNNGTWVSRPAPISLPSQTGNDGKYLKTDGSFATWVDLPLTSIYTQANSSYDQANTALTTGQSAFTQANAAFTQANTKYSSSGGTISGSVTITNDLSVSGNVYLSGNVTTISSNNIIINDPIIYLANNNVGNVQDIGFVGHFTDTKYQHTGLVRKASDGIWRLFSNVSSEPSSTIDFTDVNYDSLQIGTLITSNATFTTLMGNSPFTVISNTTVANLNADLLDGQHGTYYTTLSNSAFTQANSSYAQANSAFSQANIALTTGQSAFNQANSSYAQANSALTTGEFAFNQANSSYAQANIALTAGQSAFNQANSGFTQANSSYAQANVALTTGQSAFTQANSSYAQANSAFNQGNSAFSQANVALTTGQSAFNQGNSAFSQANSSYAQANSAFSQANTALTASQSKVTSFFQNLSPVTSNTKDTWIHSDTGVKYENVGNTSNPVWIECGPSAISGNLLPGIVSGTSVLSSNGVYSTGTYTGSYTDGIVLDYVNGNGRISVGGNDGLTFYNSGTGANTLLTISPAGQIYSNYTGANAGATLMLSGNNTIGGSGYFDFLKVTNNAPGATNPSKTIRLNVTGGLEIIDNAYGNTLFLMDNSGHIITSGFGLLTTNRPAFKVVGNGGAVSATTTMTSTNWTVDFNQGNYLNSSTGIFTAPVQGLYQVNVIVRTNSNSLNAISQIIIQKTAYSGGATSTQIMVEFGNNTSMNHAGGSAIVKMAVGDTLKFIVSAGTISFDGNDNWSVAYIG
jgi:putative membrane protein/RND superfamily putative drug exporter